MVLIVLSLWINKMLNCWKNQEVTLPAEELRGMAIFSERNFKKDLFLFLRNNGVCLLIMESRPRDCCPCRRAGTQGPSLTQWQRSYFSALKLFLPCQLCKLAHGLRAWKKPGRDQVNILWKNENTVNYWS